MSRQTPSFEPKIVRFLQIVREKFKQATASLEPGRGPTTKFPLVDALLSGLAIYQMKIPSLLQYDLEETRGSLVALFNIKAAPSDTRLREILDELDPEILRSSFTALFNHLRSSHHLEEFKVFDNYYVLSVDGTQHFCSDSVKCANCLTKVSKSGKITYSHQSLGCSLVSPDIKQVIPFCPEPIVRQDGNSKNDCEINAFKRLLERNNAEHPRLKCIYVLDGLYSVAPVIRKIKENELLRFVITAKPGDHTYLFDHLRRVGFDFELYDEDDKGTTYRYRGTSGMPLNEANSDLKVNFVEVVLTDKKGKKTTLTYVTDLDVNQYTIKKIVAIGRARWRIENETFNTLKNQGYNFEHNYGHGNKNLSTIFSMLMFLAFFIDQAQELTCRLFQQARLATRTKYNLWGAIRTTLYIIDVIPSWSYLFHILIHKIPASAVPINST